MNRAAELLARCRPELEIRSLETMGEGDFCRAYLLNQQLVVRIPKHEAAARALEREACLLPRIAPLLSVSVPVPAHVPCAGGESLALHECVPGDALTSEMWHRLPERERDHLAHRVGEFLATLHGIDAALGRACGLDVVDHRALVEGLQQELLDTPGSILPEFLRRGVASCLRRYLSGAIAADFTPAILHADISPGHVLVNADRSDITGVIDWGDSRIGDPARDFIFLHEDWGSDFLRHALEAYEPETPERLLPRVYLQYLADQLEWTLAAGAAGRGDDMEHGIALLSAGVLELEKSMTP